MFLKYYCFVLLALLFACSSGKTVVSTIAYHSILAEENVSYYKVTIASQGRVTKYNYTSGWYPTSASDRLFAKGSGEETTDTIEILDFNVDGGRGNWYPRQTRQIESRYKYILLKSRS